MTGNTVDEDRLDRYFRLAEQALDVVKSDIDRGDNHRGKDLYELASSYVEDARHFADEGDTVLAFGALNFAHGLLDAGVRVDVYDVHDPEVFTQDESS